MQKIPNSQYQPIYIDWSEEAVKIRKEKNLSVILCLASSSHWLKSVADEAIFSQTLSTRGK